MTTIDASDRLIAALWALSREQIDALPPAERRRLVEALDHALRIAKGEDAVVARARSGVLADLRDGRGRQ
jgi:hypothetical protein